MSLLVVLMPWMLNRLGRPPVKYTVSMKKKSLSAYHGHEQGESEVAVFSSMKFEVEVDVSGAGNEAETLESTSRHPVRNLPSASIGQSRKTWGYLARKLTSCSVVGRVQARDRNVLD